MTKSTCLLILFVLLVSTGVKAQIDSIKHQLPKDSVARLYDKSIVKTKVVQITDSLNPKVFKPDPFKVVWMATIIPGYGQILNKKYWKLPIVYGGFLGCAYAITWNSGRYQSYKTAFLDITRYQTDNSFKLIVDKNPDAVSFNQIRPKGSTIEQFGGITGYTAILKNAQDGSRRYRDLSIIATIGFYALTIIDAYVDAQLYDFDISPDLSMKIQPALMQNKYGFTNTLGLQCCINLK
ncbi:MAG: DUF5683 domain-containing protein [Paludibacter sp.]|nr:DUF5683 domain-containing protein [Paludibacter sp.]